MSLPIQGRGTRAACMPVIDHAGALAAPAPAGRLAGVEPRGPAFPFLRCRFGSGGTGSSCGQLPASSEQREDLVFKDDRRTVTMSIRDRDRHCAAMRRSRSPIRSHRRAIATDIGLPRPRHLPPVLLWNINAAGGGRFPRASGGSISGSAWFGVHRKLTN